MRSYLIRKIRAALEELEFRVQRRVTLEGVDCKGALFSDQNLVLLSYDRAESADDLVLTVLHEAAHYALQMREYELLGAMEEVLFRSRLLRELAARKAVEALLDYVKRRKQRAKNRAGTGRQ